jgi:hypothetical protein
VNRITRAIAALLGVSAYSAGMPALPSLSDGEADEARARFGGNIAPLPTTRTRWYLSDLEEAEHAADRGQLGLAAQLMRATMRDGIVSGAMSTRTGGLVRLPKRFRGRAEYVQALEVGVEEARSVFDEMMPPSELEKLAADGVFLGVGVGEFQRVVGRDYPVFVRLNPEFLVYYWQENRWYYKSIIGLLPITPGDGRWVLHTPGGRSAPWQWGLWRAVGRAYIRKDHAGLHLDNWLAKLANPARVAIAPQGSSEDDRQSFFRRVMAWGINTVFSLTPGWDVKLLESNGRGHESFEHTVTAQNEEIIIAIAGQTVTTDGGTGFANADVHKSIRADLIKATADALAHTVNTQCIPQFLLARFGEEALYDGVVVEWDVTPPKDKTSESAAMQTVATAIKSLDEALASRGLEVDADQVLARFGVPTRERSTPALPAASASPSNVVPLRRAEAS